MKWNQNIGSPVSSSYAVSNAPNMIAVHIDTGEPTVEEKAKLLIAALDLGSPPILTTTSHIASVNNTIPWLVPNPNKKIVQISRRSIAAICGTPSSEICTHSKSLYDYV